MRTVAMLVASLAVVACGPSVWVSGTVKAPPGPGCPSATVDLRRVTEASVTLVCPPPSEPRQAETNGDGKFFFVDHQPFKNDCILRVSKTGFAARELRIGDICAWDGAGRATNGCERATASIALVPEGDRR